MFCFFYWRYNPSWVCILQPSSGLQPPRVRGFLITHNDAPQSVGLLWTSVSLNVPYINILYSVTPCSCPKFGAGLNIKLRLWDKCQVTENAPISKNEYMTLRCLVKAKNEYGAMVDWGLTEKNRRSSEQNCFSVFYPPPVSHNVPGIEPEAP
jgi:hypothetical protein